MKLIISKRFFRLFLKMLLFDKLTTVRAKILCFLLFVAMFSVTGWLVNWFLLSIKNGWF